MSETAVLFLRDGKANLTEEVDIAGKVNYYFCLSIQQGEWGTSARSLDTFSRGRK